MLDPEEQDTVDAIVKFLAWVLAVGFAIVVVAVFIRIARTVVGV